MNAKKIDQSINTFVDFSCNALSSKINFSTLSQYNSKSLAKYYSIKYVTAGTENYSLDGEQIKLKKGKFIFVKPKQKVEVVINSPEPTKGICIYFTKEVFENKVFDNKQYDLILPQFPILSDHLLPKGFFQNLTPNKVRNNPEKQLSTCLENFSTFLYNSNMSLNSIGAQKSSTKRFLWEKIEIGRQFIISNLNSKLKLENIARKAMLSQYHFQRVFTQIYHISPANFLFELRMKKALEYLQEDNYNWHEIAHSCGFDDVKYFKKCLNKYKLQCSMK